MVQIDPDISEAKRILSIIAPDGDVTFQTYDDNKERKSPDLKRKFHGANQQNFAELIRLNKAGAGVCFMVNRGDGKGRKAENVKAVRAIFVDLDEDGQEKREKVERLEAGGPRLIVESSPGKYHAYWLIDGQLPLDCFTPIQKHFIGRFGGDPNPCDLPRVMRLPGYFHLKSEPFQTRIIFDNPEARPLPATLLEKKARALSTSPKSSKLSAGNALNAEFQVGSPQSLPSWLEDALKQIDSQPYDEWLKVGMALHHATGGSESGFEIFIKWSSNAANFDQESCWDKWSSFGDNQGEKLTLGTIYHLAQEGGWTGPKSENLTDAGNGKRLIRCFGKDLRFVPEAGKWLMYDKGRWEWDTDGGMYRYAKKTTDLMLQEARKVKDDEQRQRLFKHGLASESCFRLKAMIDLAATEQEAVLHQNLLDCNPNVLGIASGVLNLRTGEIRPGGREDYITKKSNVSLTSSTDSCSVWLGFLDKVMAGTPELIKYLQRAVGYSLTGHTTEQCLFFLYGLGANGKSTFLNVLQGLMGEYCMAIDPETIMLKSNSGGATPELARLMGARAVITNEIEEGKRLAENSIKQMTGGDTMIARHLYQEPFEFKPEFKIWMAGNHKPTIRGTDHAIWRRIHLVPFTVTIPKDDQDPKLPEKLKSELPGILQWAVEGAKEWRIHGLNPPKQVKAAVEIYRDEMDTMGHWLDECCTFGNEHKTESTILYQSYNSWCQLNGHYPQSQTRFGTVLGERGLKKTKTGKISWSGIGLKPHQRYRDV